MIQLISTFSLRFQPKSKRIFLIYFNQNFADPFTLPKVFTQQRRHSAITEQYTTTLTHSPRSHPI